MFKLLKNLLYKAREEGRDPNEAMMLYRNAPLQSGRTPMQLLQGRQARSNLPMSYAAKLKAGLAKNRLPAENIRVTLKGATKPSHDLHVGQHVMYQTLPDKRWYPAKISARMPQSRSYEIITPDGVTYRRTQQHLKPYTPRSAQKIPARTAEPELPSLCPRREIKAPSRFDW